MIPFLNSCCFKYDYCPQCPFYLKIKWNVINLIWKSFTNRAHEINSKKINIYIYIFLCSFKHKKFQTELLISWKQSVMIFANKWWINIPKLCLEQYSFSQKNQSNKVTQLEILRPNRIILWLYYFFHDIWYSWRYHH